MDIFADTADIEEIKKLNDLGIIDGVTTNPTLIAKSGRDLREGEAKADIEQILEPIEEAKEPAWWVQTFYDIFGAGVKPGEQ